MTDLFGCVLCSCDLACFMGVSVAEACPSFPTFLPFLIAGPVNYGVGLGEGKEIRPFPHCLVLCVT